MQRPRALREGSGTVGPLQLSMSASATIGATGLPFGGTGACRRCPRRARGMLFLSLAISTLLVLPASRADDPSFLRGDANGDRTIDISDPFLTLSYLFFNPTAEPPCLDAVDADDSGG